MCLFIIINLELKMQTVNDLILNERWMNQVMRICVNLIWHRNKIMRLNFRMETISVLGRVKGQTQFNIVAA